MVPMWSVSWFWCCSRCLKDSAFCIGSFLGRKFCGIVRWCRRLVCFFFSTLHRGAWYIIRHLLRQPVTDEEMGSCCTKAKCEDCQQHLEEIGELRRKNECLQHQLAVEKDRNAEIEHKNMQLKSTLEELQRRSDELTEAMAKRMEEVTKGKLESTNDENAPTKLAKRFHDIYEGSWGDIVSSINVDELTAIHLLNRLLQACDQFCKDKVEKGDAALLFSDERNQDKMCKKRSDEDLASVKLQWQNQCQQLEEYRKVEAKLNADDSDCFQSYLDECVECCWLMAISVPPVILKFPEKGKPLDHTTQKWFDIYSTQDTVVGDYPLDAVMHVAWPAVLKEREDGFYERGEVVTVDRSETHL